MGYLLDTTLVVDPETNAPVLLRAGDDIPKWAAGLIGDHLIGDSPDAEPVAHDAPKGTQDPGKAADSEIPRKAGPGSSTDAWAAYAAKHGVVIDADPKRDEIIAALEAANIPTE